MLGIPICRRFRSYGRDQFWDEHSVRLVAEMVDSCPRWINEGHVSTIPSRRVFWPLWGEKQLLFAPTSNVQSIEELRAAHPEMLSFHLWTSHPTGTKTTTDILTAACQFNGSIFGAVVRSVAYLSLDPDPKRVG